MIIVLAVFIGSLSVFIYVVRKIFIIKDHTLDSIRDYLVPYVNETNTKIMLFFTFLGKHQFLIPANLVLIAYFLLIKKNKWVSIKIPAIALSSLALMFGLKRLFGRNRPSNPLLENVHGLSFPSGHALMSVTFYGLLIYIVFKTIKNNTVKWVIIACLTLLIHLIGFSRIYFNVHYTTDVIAGLSMGFLWLVLCIWVLNNLENYSSKKLKAVTHAPST
jgi:undecaprenyl-diphosphatase